jgi:hypothetical protein
MVSPKPHQSSFRPSPRPDRKCLRASAGQSYCDSWYIPSSTDPIDKISDLSAHAGIASTARFAVSFLAANDAGDRSIDIIELSTANIDDEGFIYVELDGCTSESGFLSKFTQFRRCTSVARIPMPTVDVGRLHNDDQSLIDVGPKTWRSFGVQHRSK